MFRTRPDATLVGDVPAYRRMMPYLMRTRNECVVYFELQADLDEAERFITEFNDSHEELTITVFHLVMWAMVQVLEQRPRLNRFVAGGKLWQREGIWLSYSAKKRKDDRSPIVVVKRRFDPQEPFEEMVRSMLGGLREERSDRKSHVDREMDVVLALPSPIIRALIAAGKAVDGLGLLPRSFIDGDPMYASAFIANLGSLKMDAAYHHLYEYGNIPIFCVIGQNKEVPAVQDGKLVSRRVATLRFSYDERVEDGLYAQRSLQQLREILENPHENI